MVRRGLGPGGGAGVASKEGRGCAGRTGVVVGRGVPDEVALVGVSLMPGDASRRIVSSPASSDEASATSSLASPVPSWIVGSDCTAATSSGGGVGRCDELDPAV